MPTRHLLRPVLFLLTFGLTSCLPDGPPPDLAIRNVTVIDAVNGVREGQTVVVRGGEIEKVASGQEPVEAAEVVDGTGQYLIPGLWDFHVHLTYDERFTEAMPGLFLRHGITSIRDTGGLMEKLLPVVETLRTEGVTAPRVFFAGPLLDGEHVVYDGTNRPGLGIGNQDVETARANVKRLADAGVDFIKIYEMITPEVFEAIVEASEARGLPMAGHVPLSMIARDVGPHVQVLEHLRNFELDCTPEAETYLAERRKILAAPLEGSGASLRSRLHRLQRLPAIATFDENRCNEMMESMASTIQVPTLRLNSLELNPPFFRADWDAALDMIPDTVAKQWRTVTERRRSTTRTVDNTFAEWSLFLVGRMHEERVPFGAGTDTPISYSIPGYSLHSELEMLVRAGLSPMEALYSATVRPAEFFGLSGEMGTVEEGRLADLVLLSSNPLEDIANTRTVQAVVSKGELMTLEELNALLR